MVADVTSRILEREDVRTIPLEGHRVSRCVLDFGFSLFLGGTGGCRGAAGRRGGPEQLEDSALVGGGEVLDPTIIRWARRPKYGGARHYTNVRTPLYLMPQPASPSFPQTQRSQRLIGALCHGPIPA